MASESYDFIPDILIKYKNCDMSKEKELKEKKNKKTPEKNLKEKRAAKAAKRAAKR